MEIEEADPLPLLSLNHVSILCRSVWTSVRFYEEVLGFFLIKRPSSFDFPGAWLFNYGVGIHLLESSTLEDYDPMNNPRPINPKDNHISFQCTKVGQVKRKLEEWGIRYVTAMVEEGGKKVDQVFFHDPDGYMIEICNCDNLPILPLCSCSNFKMISSIQANDTNHFIVHSSSSATKCGLFREKVMMESLKLDMINFSY